MSLFGMNDRERLDDTIAFLQHIQGVSEDHKNRLIVENKNNIKLAHLISLGMALNNNKQEKERKRALRALLLCVGTVKEAEIPHAKQWFQNKSMDELVDGIKSYFPLSESNASSVVKVITDKAFAPKMGSEPHGGSGFYKYTRGALLSGVLAGAGNCYGSACWFLYLGGVVSLRWLQKYGSQKGSAAPVTLFNFGPKLTEPVFFDRLGAGRLLYYFRPPAGVHYTISIGHGECAGNNQSNDAVINWPKGYGPAPAPTFSTFKISGYLKACQDDLVKNKRPATDAYVLMASCVPKHPY
jgi:hypothetical protein